MTDTRYAVESLLPPRDLLTWNGRVLIHNSRAEMEFLLAGEIRVIELPRDVPPEQCLELRYHPNFATVTWPLRREDFR